VYSPSFIRELGTQRAYHETYAFWTNPENIISTEDLEALYQHWEGQGFRYYEPEEEIGQVWYVGYYSDGRCSSLEFEIPEVWGGNKRYVFLIEVKEMSSDPKAPEAMEWQGGERPGGDEGSEGGDELSSVQAPSVETTITHVARSHPTDQTPRSPVGLGFLEK